MSSLRLALKLSMEDGGGPPAPVSAAEAPKEKAPPKRKRSESTASLKGEGGSEKDAGHPKKKENSSTPKENSKKKTSLEKSVSSAPEKKSGEGKSKSDSVKKKDSTDKATDGSNKREKSEKIERKHSLDKKDMDQKDGESQPKKKRKEKESGDKGKGESAQNGTGSQINDNDKDREQHIKTQTKKKENSKAKEKKADDAEDDVDEVDDDGSEDKDEDDTQEEIVVPRYQSSRAAAQVAKDKLSAKGFKASINEEYAPVSHSKPRPSKPSQSLPSQWVQCDKCTKWRSIPGNVDMDTLPEQWYCSMNKWDPSRRSCSAKEGEGTAGGGEEDEDSLDETGERGENEDGYTIGNTGGSVKSEPKRRGGGSHRAAEAATAAVGVVERVNWVQCNRCQKWRKAPLSIDPETLPDVWHCAMNHWAPHMAKCSIKEEEDEEPDPALATGGFATTLPGHSSLGAVGAGSGSKSRRQSGAGGTPLNTGSTTKKKVVQWVQCERKNCKKWRKLPGHVDLSTLPEKWYCDMNQWDLDRASCDVPDDSDEEPEEKTNISSQLITGNTKGPSALSYRRIIFGTDGKVRPVYNEKNKNGYGIFSYSESRRHAEKYGNSEENVEPTSRLSYWWASSYDEAGAMKQRAEAARKASTGSGRGRHHLHKDKSTTDTGAEKGSMSVTANSDKGPQEKNESASASSPTSPRSSTGGFDGVVVVPEEPNGTSTCGDEKSKSRQENGIRQNRHFGGTTPASCHLLQMARRMGGWEVGNSGRPYLGKHHKARHGNDSISYMRKEQAALTILRSCLISVGHLKQVPLHDVMQVVDTAYFHSAELEGVRRTMNMQTFKAALKQLEMQGEVDVTMNEGQVCITLCTTYRGKSSDTVVANKWQGAGVPLKLRKKCQSN